MPLLVACFAFTVFDKSIGRDVIQRWRPKTQLDLTYWPSVDGWLRARLALEANCTPFVLFKMNEEYKTRAFVCSRDDGVHVLRACVWDPFDDAEAQREIFSDLSAWHKKTFPDLPITIGDLPEQELYTWEHRR
jgi:hypothetical protein